MSEHRDDDEELEAFLSRGSVLSRRYRESSDEQPPEHVDAAILAASRWAVGAEKIGAKKTGAEKISAEKTGADRTSSEPTGADRTGAEGDTRGARHAGLYYSHASRSGARWRRSAVARWSVPLAMAAVVVLAVTLTITLERDPELDRIYQRHDSPAPAEGEALRDVASAEADVAAPPAPAAEAVSPGVTAKPGKPAAPLPLAKQEPAATSPADLSPQVKEQIARQPAQQDRLAARKRSEMPQQGFTADQSVRRDAPATLAEEQVAEKVAPTSPSAEPFPGGISAETKVAEDGDTGISPLNEAAPLDDLARRDASVDEIAAADETARVDPSTSVGEARDDSEFAGSSELAEAEEPSSAAVTAPGRAQALAPAPLAVPQAEQEPAGRELAESAQPAEILAAESVREPGRWIEDIEELLAQGRRAEAVDSLKEFRIEYPDYELPPNLQALLPATAD